jgi:hypothetical protein
MSYSPEAVVHLLRLKVLLLNALLNITARLVPLSYNGELTPKESDKR